jgi:hypothetical protein
MRPILVAGALILALGAFLLIRGGTFTTRRDVIKVGDVKISADSKESLPPWVGWIAVAAGGALLVSGLRKRAA